MKRIVLLVIVCTIVYLCSLSCAAFYWPHNVQPAVDLSNPNISKEDQDTLDELAEVVANIYDFFLDTHFRMPVYDNNSITIPGYDTTYHKVRESYLPGGSFNGMISKACNLFTSDIAAKSYTYYSISQQIPLFYINEDGLYATGRSFGYQFYLMEVFNYMNSPKMFFDNMVITETNATGRLLYNTDVDGPIEDWGPLYWFDVAFEKDDGMWKMSDCAVFRLHFDCLNFSKDNYICYDKELYDQFGVTFDLESPSTGDPSFDSFVLLPAVSLACVIPAACLVRRRRKRTT